MPEATAVKSSPIKPEQPPVNAEENWVKYNDQGQADFQESVKNKLAEAGIKHDPVPITQNGVPIHVPDGSTVNKNMQKIPLVSGSYGETKTPFSGLADLSEHLDYADQLVTGRDHVIHAADRFTRQKDERAEKVLKEKNSLSSEGKIEKIKDWFYHKKSEKEKAA